MSKLYNIEFFTCKVNGREYTFRCYTTNTRNGFCHTAQSWDAPRVTDTKVSYLNRTWESFRYETVLRRMISKFPKEMQDEMTAQLIERKFREEEERCNKQFEDFEKLYSGLSPENKERMKSFPELQGEDDVRACMGFMGLLTLMQG